MGYGQAMTQSYSARDFKAVALDVDGTITGPDHQVLERAKSAIRQLESRGIWPIILTGRRSAAVFDLAADCGLQRPMVSNNGATIIHTGTGETLDVKTLPRQIVDEVIEVGRDLNLGVCYWTVEHILVLERAAEIADLEQMAGDNATLTTFDEVPLDNLIKLNFFGPAERLDKVQPFLERNLPVMRRSAVRFFESATPGATKLEGLRFCLDDLGVGLHETVGVADGENDLEFISGVRLGVATANAYPRLKERADLEIGESAADATAIFLEELFELDPWQG